MGQLTFRLPKARVLALWTPLIFVCLLVCLMILPLRNVILYPVLPPAWRDVTTGKLLGIYFYSIDHIDANETEKPWCPVKFKPTSSLLNIDRAKIKFYSLSTLLVPNYAFAPLMSHADKLRLVQLYRVFAEAMRAADLNFFLGSGSMLGALRHQGMIPWDDDIDVYIDYLDWKRVLAALGCVENHHVFAQQSMHWRFVRDTPGDIPFKDLSYLKFLDTPGFPFIDIFFYTGDDEYIWAVAPFVRPDLLFRRSDVFPLATAQFEGLTIPVPRRAMFLTKLMYDYDTCQSSSMDHKTNQGSESEVIPCHLLKNTYPMYGLK